MPKKKVVKKKPKKKFKSSHPDIDIKVRNLDKLGDACSPRKSKPCNHCSGFWVFGSALAMILSYERSASILWAIGHGALSWFYIAFRAMQGWGWF
jgi:hypothetical protein